jgi:hypothetical protein
MARINWLTLNRRIHVYLALFLLPWFVLYGVSAFPFAHPSIGEAAYNDGRPTWIPRGEHTFSEPVPPGDGPEALRPLGRKILDRVGLQGSFGTYRQGPQQVNVYIYTFWKSTQVKYFLDRNVLRVEERRFRLDHFLTGMHARGGFEQGDWLTDAWAWAVDLVCIGLLGWVVSGLIMWWQIPPARRAGWIVIAASLAGFGLLIWRL